MVLKSEEIFHYYYIFLFLPSTQRCRQKELRAKPGLIIILNEVENVENRILPDFNHREQDIQEKLNALSISTRTSSFSRVTYD